MAVTVTMIVGDHSATCAIATMYMGTHVISLQRFLNDPRCFISGDPWVARKRLGYHGVKLSVLVAVCHKTV